MRSFSSMRRLLLHCNLSTAAAAGSLPHPLSSTHAFSPALRRLARAKDFAAIESLLDPLTKSPTSEPQLAAVAASYAASGMLPQALSSFSLIRNPSTSSFNSLLSSLNHHPHLFSNVPSFFLDLPKKHPSIAPDAVSFSILIKSHCKAGKTLKCFPILEEMQKKQIPVNVVTYTTILDSLYKEKKLKEAEKLWEEMKEKKLDLDVAAYNVRVMHKVGSGKVEDVLKVVEEMEKNGLKPDAITKNYLIGCFAKRGRWKEAAEIYEGMGKEGRNHGTYKVYLEGLVKQKKKDLDAALKVFNEAVKEGKVPDLGVVKRLVEGLMNAERKRMAKRVVTGLRKKFDVDFGGGWLELEKIVGLEKGGAGEGEDDEKDVKVVAA